jgi:hypothetical protein
MHHKKRSPSAKLCVKRDIVRYKQKEPRFKQRQG